MALIVLLSLDTIVLIVSLPKRRLMSWPVVPSTSAMSMATVAFVIFWVIWIALRQAPVGGAIFPQMLLVVLSAPIDIWVLLRCETSSPRDRCARLVVCFCIVGSLGATSSTVVAVGSFHCRFRLIALLSLFALLEFIPFLIFGVFDVLEPFEWTSFS